MLVLGHIWPFLCQKYQLLMRVNQSFGTHITEDPPRHLVCIALLVGPRIKWAQNANFWPKMPVLGSVKICLLLWKLKLVIFQKKICKNLRQPHSGTSERALSVGNSPCGPCFARGVYEGIIISCLCLLCRASIARRCVFVLSAYKFSYVFLNMCWGEKNRGFGWKITSFLICPTRYSGSARR